MAKKAKTTSKVLKKKTPTPNHLQSSEAKEIEAYPLSKESYKQRLTILELRVLNTKIQSKLDIIEIEGEMSKIHSLVTSEREKYNNLVVRLKLKYGVEQLSYDPDTLELGV